MLGIMLVPDGNSKTQFDVSYEKAVTCHSKIKHSKLHNKVKWAAIISILEPRVLYPLMANLNTTTEIKKKRSNIKSSKMSCARSK